MTTPGLVAGFSAIVVMAPAPGFLRVPSIQNGLDKSCQAFFAVPEFVSEHLIWACPVLLLSS